MDLSKHKIKLEKFSSSDIANNVDQVLKSYDEHGIISLKNFISNEARQKLLLEMTQIQEDGEQELKENWYLFTTIAS